MKNIIFFAAIIFFGSCEPRQGKSVDEAPAAATGLTEIVAQEVLQASSYTYIKSQENNKDIWMAIPKREVQTGKTYYFDRAAAMEMVDFKSKDLERTFKSIYFLGGIFDTDQKSNITGNVVPNDENHKKKTPTQKQELNIEREEGVIAIGSLFDNKSDYENKKIKVKGIVTKYNGGIMNKNWVHIQDGTGGEKSFDLTITTLDVVEVGAIATFEGIVAVNKDFGAGYKYDLIMEDASQINKMSDTKVN